jgi:Flp pilus assembly pilin Flp
MKYAACIVGLPRTGNGYKYLSERNMHQVFSLISKRVTSLRRLLTEADGSVFVEYLLLLTLVGIGVIVGLAAVRTALINELVDLATAISSIACP